METAMRHSLVDRAIGAAMLQVPVYEEVEHDTDATVQAAIVVGVVAVARAIGHWHFGPMGLVSGILSAYIGWAVWAATTYYVGTWLGGKATWGEMLRTIGFAQAPGVLLVVAIIPILGWLVSLVVAIWLLVAGFIAIRQALDFDNQNGKALATALIGLVLYIVVAAIIGSVLGLGARAF